MSMPGFSAQASLYQHRRIYRVAIGFGSALTDVRPAASFNCDCSYTDKKLDYCQCQWAVGRCKGFHRIWADGAVDSDAYCPETLPIDPFDL